jgi:hypothetical protein
MQDALDLPLDVAEEIGAMGYKDDLQRVHDKIDRVSTQLGNHPALPVSKWTIASPIITGCALLLALWVAYSNHSATDLKNQIKNGVDDQLRDPLKQLGGLSGDVKEIKGKLEVLDPLIRDLISKRIRAALSDKDLNARLPDLDRLIDLAQKERVAVDPKLLHLAATNIGHDAIRTTAAWKTTLSLANYRSTLNEANKNLPVSNATPTPIANRPEYGIAANFETPLGMNHKTLEQSLLISLVGASTPEDAAHLELFSTPNAAPSEAQYIILESTNPDIALKLDNMYLKNVIVKNLKVRYHGGAAKLQNVYFVNCTFEIDQQPSGLLFAEAVLSPNLATTFELS